MKKMTMPPKPGKKAPPPLKKMATDEGKRPKEMPGRMKMKQGKS